MNAETFNHGAAREIHGPGYFFWQLLAAPGNQCWQEKQAL
jgi:hypothetical protein